MVLQGSGQLPLCWTQFAFLWARITCITTSIPHLDRVVKQLQMKKDESEGWYKQDTQQSILSVSKVFHTFFLTRWLDVMDGPKQGPCVLPLLLTKPKVGQHKHQKMCRAGGRQHICQDSLLFPGRRQGTPMFSHRSWQERCRDGIEMASQDLFAQNKMPTLYHGLSDLVMPHLSPISLPSAYSSYASLFPSTIQDKFTPILKTLCFCFLLLKIYFSRFLQSCFFLIILF